MQRKALFLTLVALLPACGVAVAADPTIADIDAAVSAWWKAAPVAGTGGGPPPRVAKLWTCFPAREHPTILVCRAQFKDDATHRSIPLKPSARGFAVVVDKDGDFDSGLRPACPPPRETERSLRHALKDDRLSVQGEGVLVPVDFDAPDGKPIPGLRCMYDITTGAGQRHTASVDALLKSGVWVFGEHPFIL